MRLSRTSLLQRLTGSDSPVVLLEAPPGYGKSWLARRATEGDVVRLRAEVGPLVGPADQVPGTVVIDDGHLLTAEDVDRLVAAVERAGPGRRLIVAGRILADALHEVAHLVDGDVIDADSLAIEADEVSAEWPQWSSEQADQLVQAADGCVRAIATALDQLSRDPRADPIAIASGSVRIASAAALQHLTPREQAVIGMLARAPGIDRHLLDKLAGPGFVERAVVAGAPLRRQPTGGFDLATASAFRSVAIPPNVAAELAAELVERDRGVEAVGLLLDAGDVPGATGMLMNLSESIIDTVEPRIMTSLLGRLGTTAEREPALLLLRASAERALGLLDKALADIDRAVAAAMDAPPPLRRRVAVESARARLAQGDAAAAVRIAEETLAELGSDETRTYAGAHEVLADCASTSNAREDLQQAVESYRTAAAAWESCREFARARACRRDLALGPLVALGRYDEALAQLNILLSTPDLSDAERSWTIMVEGFVLLNANRLDSADARLTRVADLGHLLDNPRLVVVAAWGHALVASRRNDEPTMRYWIHQAELTSFGPADDVLGVPFCCDMALVFGAFGDLDTATRYLDDALVRKAVFPELVRSAEFLLDARKGRVGDVAAGLACTVPAEWWRVKLLVAHALASAGDLEGARARADESEQELVSLGFSDPSSLGEARTYRELQAMLTGETSAPAATDPTGDAAVAPTPASRAPVVGPRLVAMGHPISVVVGGQLVAVPAGHPQRVVGVLLVRGGTATMEQMCEAIWPGEDLDVCRSRMRNVLLRLRDKVGEVVVRTPAGLRLAAGFTSDLLDFRRLATDALAAARADPELAGELATAAVALEAPIFIDYEYEEWAVTARRSAELQLISLLDLLSVQAEDAGNLPQSQALAERALRYDRYTDSRYVRLAELLTMQNRVAAAMAVLEDAAEVAKELGETAPVAVPARQDEPVPGGASAERRPPEADADRPPETSEEPASATAGAPKRRQEELARRAKTRGSGRRPPEAAASSGQRPPEPAAKVRTA